MGELLVMETRATPGTGEATVEMDFSIWQKAPKERTAAYSPRDGVREWFTENAETILLRPHTAYPILAYLKWTRPFFRAADQHVRGRHSANRSAQSGVASATRMLATKRFA